MNKNTIINWLFRIVVSAVCYLIFFTPETIEIKILTIFLFIVFWIALAAVEKNNKQTLEKKSH